MRGCTSGGARSQRADPAESSGLGVGERYGPCVHDELERSRGGARWGATAASHFWARTGQGFALCSQMCSASGPSPIPHPKGEETHHVLRNGGHRMARPNTNAPSLNRAMAREVR